MRDGESLKGQVAAKIGPFLGKHAARRLLESVSGNGEDLLCSIEPILAGFLGDEAASDLVTYVVDAVIVRS